MADIKYLDDLELMEVYYNDTKTKATMVFLDEENGEIREVSFNKQIFDNGKYIDDEAKAKQVEQWCQDYFNTTFDNLVTAVGQKKRVYVYDTFSSLWEAAERPSKFTKDMLGQIFTTDIKEIIVDDYFIKIRYEIDDTLYESKQTYGKYHEGMRKWFKDPVKQKKEYEKFLDKYGVPVDHHDELIGKQIFVEVKCAFKKFYYGDIKAFPKKGK